MSYFYFHFWQKVIAQVFSITFYKKLFEIIVDILTLNPKWFNLSLKVFKNQIDLLFHWTILAFLDY